MALPALYFTLWAEEIDETPRTTLTIVVPTIFFLLSCCCCCCMCCGGGRGSTDSHDKSRVQPTKRDADFSTCTSRSVASSTANPSDAPRTPRASVYGGRCADEGLGSGRRARVQATLEARLTPIAQRMVQRTSEGMAMAVAPAMAMAELTPLKNGRRGRVPDVTAA